MTPPAWLPRALRRAVAPSAHSVVQSGAPRNALAGAERWQRHYLARPTSGGGPRQPLYDSYFVFGSRRAGGLDYAVRGGQLHWKQLSRCSSSERTATSKFFPGCRAPATSSGPRPARRGHGAGVCGGALASSARQDERYSGRVTLRFALSLHTITSADAHRPSMRIRPLMIVTHASVPGVTVVRSRRTSG